MREERIMSSLNSSSFFSNNNLSKRTPIFGLSLFTLLGISIAASILILLFLTLFLCFRLRLLPIPSPSSSSSSSTSSSGKPLKLHIHNPSPPISKEILLIPAQNPQEDRRVARIISDSVASPSNLGWGKCYTTQELEEATGNFAEANVIGEGGYGVVYRGVLPDDTTIAIKNLLNNRGQAEKEFRVEVEAIGRVGHKNLVRLLGYCVEGACRMLVYEYIDNGTLDQWLHGNMVEHVSPLTWDIRMRIALGAAKGLAYLHEGLEPKVVHRDVKSSNILLDKLWNAKLSDFGLAKLVCSQTSYVTTRVMGTFGYVAPEYASTGMLSERSDVYSFGVLIVELISGRIPVDYSRPAGEVNLVEWLKNMVGERRYEEVMDPKMFEKPSLKKLKRALLVALRCVDLDALKRPKMGHVVHMLEMEGLLLHEDLGYAQDAYNEPFLSKN
ncbi:putative serine/threonine-protein kinase [Platanthera guangdongensis]|uniref:Serine/threonine-protein kinase n=1 Tax=Platanthera guangdongensis TaxID=2320717 RepID=A0ABR2ML44_9ASPA